MIQNILRIWYNKKLKIVSYLFGHLVDIHYLRCVKEQVLDIALVLKSINGKIDGLTQQLDVVTKENIKLKERIVYLENRLLAYETPKDSHNSSIPLTKDTLAIQAKKAKKLLFWCSIKPGYG